MSRVRLRPLGLAVTLVAVSCGGGAASGPSPAASPAADRSGFVFDGITHVSWWHDAYDATAAPESRRALAATGANWGGLLVTWYMDTRRSSAVLRDAERTNDDSSVRRAIAQMRAAGLQVMLKPHVDVRDGTWRAQIAPDDVQAWFASYAEFVEHYAALAADEDVALFCIGTELASLSGERHAGAWREIVRRVRARYSGRLTYAANGVAPGDEFTAVAFWPELDLIGIDAYTPLTDETRPTRAQLAAGWRRNRDGHDMLAAFRNVQRAHGKPLIFTEVGYRSGDGTNREPWEWGRRMAADPEEQADCYEALYDVWSREGAWMHGLFWWAWDVAPPPSGDTGYSPRGKPAETVLRKWQRR